MPSTFSLIIPTYRRPWLVTQAVESALRQTRAFEEVIVVADGEDDPAIDALAGQPVIVLPIPHGGVSSARNAGVERASSDWVCFLDDDDLLHPEYLECLAQEVATRAHVLAFNAPYWSFAANAGPREEFVADSLDGCLEAITSASPRNDMTYLDIEGRSYDLLLARLRGSMSTAAVRKDILRIAGGFPEGVSTAEDWTMYVNVARYTEWGLLPRRLAFFRDHPAGVTHAPSVEKGLMVLRAISSFWEPGDQPVPRHRPLSAYRRYYRFELRVVLDRCRRERDFVRYRTALLLARKILPDRRDRLAAMIPGSVWRAFQHLRVGARRQNEA